MVGVLCLVFAKQKLYDILAVIPLENPLVCLEVLPIPSSIIWDLTFVIKESEKQPTLTL